MEEVLLKTVTEEEEGEEEFMRFNPLIFLIILTVVMVECTAVAAVAVEAKATDGKTLRYPFTEVQVKAQKEITVDEAQHLLVLIRELVEEAVVAIQIQRRA